MLIVSLEVLICCTEFVIIQVMEVWKYWVVNSCLVTRKVMNVREV
jgi:hypothetical protein